MEEWIKDIINEEEKETVIKYYDLFYKVYALGIKNLYNWLNNLLLTCY